MAVTKSWTATAPAIIRGGREPRARSGFRSLLAASLLAAGGIAAVYSAKVQRISGPSLNVNAVTSPDDLLPVLDAFPDRAALAPRLFDYIERARPLRHTGALTRVMPRRQFARLKPLIAVRTAREFRDELLQSAALYFAGFYLVALVWRRTGFGGDRALLPALHLLTGFGFALMISLRDPLRDTLEFHKFAIGVFCGCVLLALPAFHWFDYRRLSDWCYTPLFAALGLFGLLMMFGRGPAGNDSKVNLGPFQPVELIKVLIVLFLAGYFTRQWERLRDLRRFRDALPVACATGIALVLFFALKDLGPALVTFFVFLACFTVARGRPWLAAAGLFALVAVVAIGYRIGQPKTVAQRIDMWLAPWDNPVRGGDQLAHGLWAFSTGGPTGSGPGWGDPALIPAGHTDLVLPAIGEEWGFAGVAAACALFAFLVARGFRAAARASTTYGFFLGAGLASLIAFEMLLISSGVLGALPLSGVASPFLSSGNTAMLANFGVFAILASIGASTTRDVATTRDASTMRGASTSRDREGAVPPRPSARPLQWTLAAAAAVLLAFAARYQAFDDSIYLARDSRAIEEDGARRLHHNPRMSSLAREIPRGTIYDRNGIPLATSDWGELDRRRADYAALGVSLDTAVNRFDTRHYPFGAAAAHIIGDLRTGENFHATNASLVEHDFNRTLQGYEYAELAPLIRYRHHPDNAGVARILARDRSVHLTIDARLQIRAAELLRNGVAGGAGSLVVMDPATGDVLAMTDSAPAPDDQLDRARYGQYPPGSTFKLVTAIAALRGDPDLTRRTFLCRMLSDGRCGNRIPGWNRDIKDDIGDHAHGTLDMERAIAVSCNAYFAQLGVNDVGAKALAATAERLGISPGDPVELRRALPFASYGQGPVLISPFKMARVAATIANGGRMTQGRWITGESNTRTNAPVEVIAERQAAFIGRAMRRVVTEGTARHVMAGAEVAIAGKTGTAQLDQGLPHAWFTGFAPYGETEGPRIAFAVLVEHGGYGGRVAAPIARQVVEAAVQLGLLNEPRPLGSGSAQGPPNRSLTVAARQEKVSASQEKVAASQEKVAARQEKIAAGQERPAPRQQKTAPSQENQR
jgi:cell division protein FtsI/penicillin-binding protein 2/cell division protein FtsW (lipid II flippase)